MSTDTKALTLVDQYPPNKYNLLLPTTTAIDVTQWHRMSVSQVPISPDPRVGDVYQVASRRKQGAWGNDDAAFENLFSLARPATDRIGMAAGVNYDPTRSRVIQASGDYVAYETVGGIRRPDGSWVAFKATKEIDLRAIEMEMRENETKKVVAGLIGDQGKDAATMYPGKWEEVQTKWGPKQAFFVDPAHIGRCIDDRIRPQMIQWRKNKMMRAETGARLRVIRGLLGIRLQFTVEELALPFVVPRIDFTPDYSDPDVKRMLLAQASSAMNSLYGGRGAGVEIPKGAEVELPDDDEIEPDYRVVGKSTGDADAEPAPSRPVEVQTPNPAAAQPPPEQTRPEDPAGSPASQLSLQCSVDSCKAAIPQKVAEYSKKRWGKELCFKCQQDVKAQESVGGGSRG